MAEAAFRCKLEVPGLIVLLFLAELPPYVLCAKSLELALFMRASDSFIASIRSLGKKVC